MGITLRPYQRQGLDSIHKTHQSGHKRVIYTTATGGGKTVIFSTEILEAIKENRNARPLVLTHREEIFTQTIKKLVALGIQPGIIRGSEKMVDAQVHVAMVQSLANNVDFLKSNSLSPTLIIGDEFHHFTSNQFMKCFDGFDCDVTGYTATPQRTDGVGLKFTGASALINGPQYEDLLNPGYTGGESYLTPPCVVFSPLTAKLQKAKSRKKKGEYDKKTETEIFSEKIIVEDCIELYNKYFNGAPCIIFGASVEDCINVTARMQAEGWRGGAVYDKMDMYERRELIEGLGNGKYNFLASFDILGEGVDVPVTAGCIKRRRFAKTVILEMQQNGRPARKYPGKKYNLIIDQAGNSLIHGHPLTRRDWTLDGLKPPDGEPDIIMTICPFCNCALAGRPAECPYCGSSLVNTEPAGIEEIIEVPAPMEILPAPAYSGTIDRAEIEEFELSEQEQAIYNRIKNGQLTSYDRFGELGNMIGKDRKWCKLVWEKYHNGGRI